MDKAQVQQACKLAHALDEDARWAEELSRDLAAASRTIRDCIDQIERLQADYDALEYQRDYWHRHYVAARDEARKLALERAYQPVFDPLADIEDGGIDHAREV